MGSKAPCISARSGNSHPPHFHKTHRRSLLGQRINTAVVSAALNEVGSMSRSKSALIGLVLLAMLALPAIAPPAQAADTNVTLIARNFAWHVGSETSADTAIRATVGDTLRLRVENRDTVLHTFTAPQFGVDISLDAGEVAFWNYTVTSADVGTWQYYCIPHSTGTYPNRAGMIGTIVFSSAAPPPAGTDYTLIIAVVVVVLIVIVALAAVAMRRKKTGGPPPNQP